MSRLFIGLSIPKVVWPSLVAICRDLPYVNWQKPENLHVTLKFIGKTEPHDFERIETAIKLLCQTEAPVSLSICGVGIFGEPTETRALWAGVTPTKSLMDLQHRCEVLLKDIGIPLEERGFHPHVTLAKPKDVPENLINDYLLSHKEFVLPDFLVNEVILFSSHGGKEGSDYHVEKTFLLNK